MAKTRKSRTRTPAQARQWLVDNGISVPSFAKAQGLDVQAVKDVLYERSNARRGERHRAAIALGIKAEPSEPIRMRATA